MYKYIFLLLACVISSCHCSYTSIPSPPPQPTDVRLLTQYVELNIELSQAERNFAQYDGFLGHKDVVIIYKALGEIRNIILPGVEDYLHSIAPNRELFKEEGKRLYIILAQIVERNPLQFTPEDKIILEQDAREFTDIHTALTLDKEIYPETMSKLVKVITSTLRILKEY